MGGAVSHAGGGGGGGVCGGRGGGLRGAAAGERGLRGAGGGYHRPRPTTTLQPGHLRHQGMYTISHLFLSVISRDTSFVFLSSQILKTFVIYLINVSGKT